MENRLTMKIAFYMFVLETFSKTDYISKIKTVLVLYKNLIIVDTLGFSYMSQY